MEHPEKPQLHMVWPTASRRLPIDPATAEGYAIRTYQPGDERVFLELMALMDFDPFDDQKLAYNVARIIPQGWFFAVELATMEVAGTAMCLHNYTGDTPFGGDVGWLACRPTHRGRGLGYALSAYVTNRFHEAGYTRIQLGTEYHRLPAIKTYLKLGYLPVMDRPEMDELWAEACRQIGWPFTPERWLPDFPPSPLAE
ncbi:MAG: GNAT family N-acetyltransferase [Herpetosiphonaceae bacterium]|nr:GNAT family N-acetyltransferase [Herpetosiphonaceae bacterium]